MQPAPSISVNVNRFNTYDAPDRGLFMTRRQDLPFGRIRKATWKSFGPSTALGLLSFEIDGYATSPKAPEDFLTGTLLHAPDNTTVFNCITRNPVLKPIFVEYWATEIYFKHYATGGGKLEAAEIEHVRQSGDKLTKAMGTTMGIQSVETTVVFESGEDGSCIRRKSATIAFIGKKGTATIDRSFTVTDEEFDPVLSAREYLKTQ